MVSVGQLIGMILAIVVPIAVAVLLFLQVKRESKTKGLFTASVYGALGYFWQTMVYVVAYGFLSGILGTNEWFTEGFGFVVAQLLISLLYALFVSASMVWAVYLANMRVPDRNKGIVVGIGFGVAYTVWNYVLIYGGALVYGFQIRFDAFTGTDEIKQKVEALSVENMYLFLLDMVIFTIILTGTALIMGIYNHEQKKLARNAVVFVSQFLIYFLNALMPKLLPDVVSSIIYHILMGATAVYALWLLFDYLRTEKLKFPPSLFKNRLDN